MVVVVLALFAGLVLAGVTTSSAGIGHLTQEGSSEDVSQVGTPRAIRSDEYNANTPIDLSIMTTHGEPTLSPLGADAGLVQRYSSGGFFSTVTFFDATVLKAAGVLPDATVFALRWWMPVVLLLLALPVWFQALGHSRRLGWLAAFLTVLSPAVAWWSMIPVRAFAYTAAGCALMACAYHRFARGGRVVPVVQAVLGGVLIAGMPSFYVPWSIVLGLPLLVATTLWVLTRPGSWAPRLLTTGITGGTAVVFGLGTLWEYRDSLAALLDTVYPGARRSGPEAQPFSMLFGAPGLGPLQSGDPTGTNASELSTSFTVAFVVLVVLLVAQRSLRLRGVGPEVWTLAAFSAVWLAWATVSLYGAGSRIPIFSSVPAPRAAQVVGILGVLLVCLALSRLPRSELSTALVVGAVAGAVTVYAVSLLRETYLPQASALTIVGAGLGVAVVATLVVRFPDRWWAIGVAVLLAALPVYRANPLLVGLGDLRGSTTADYLAGEGERARADGTLWVSDASVLGPVMLANGVPALSGLQRSGPVEDEWLRIDPERKYEEAWNRGGGYLGFELVPGRETEVATDGFDQTWVRTDPCVLADTFPELSKVVSGQDLDVPCLEPDTSLRWAGADFTVYDVVRGDAA